ncbi:MAG: cytochrome c [Bacteroidota bacterium]
MNLRNISTAIILGGTIILAGCRAGGDNQGTEFAPNMYHSVAYEPLKQIKNKDAGMWVNSSEDEVGEYYSSNPNNPYEMNMLEPVANTVKRGEYLPYRIHKDSLALAARIMINPLDSSDAVIAEGKRLYAIFCTHCHGADGTTPGLVGEKYVGVPSFKSPALVNITQGHIFHVLSKGKGRMPTHASQLNQEERWQLARYVQVLQNK